MGSALLENLGTFKGTVYPVKPFHEIAEVAKNGRRPHHLDAEDVNKGE